MRHRSVLLPLLAALGADSLKELAAPPQTSTPLTPHQIRHFFFAYRKTGTALVSGLCNRLVQTILGLPKATCAQCFELISSNVSGSNCVYHSTTGLGQDVKKHQRPVFYENRVNYFVTTPEAARHMFPVGVNRGVLVFRDPLVSLASDYIYESRVADNLGAGPKELQQMSLVDGLKRKARDYLAVVRREGHGRLMAQVDPNLLLLHFENFMEDFNGTVRSLFAFTNTGKDELLPAFLNLAQLEDVTQWTSRQREQHLHVSASHEKLRIIELISELCRQGDPDIMKVIEYRPRLGYPTGCGAESLVATLQRGGALIDEAWDAVA